MPTQLSKFWADCTCKEYVHPWTDSCISATAGLGLHAVQESLRIYSTVYFITLLMKAKVPTKEALTKTILGTLQSTAFLSCSAFTYSMFLCILRRLLGRFHFLTASFIPSFLSSFAAIILERPSRRTLLCLYVSNIATETLFRMGVSRGYFPVVPKGEIYIFAVSMAVLSYFFRCRTNKQDSIFRIIRFFVGSYEENPSGDSERSQSSHPNKKQGTKIKPINEKSDVDSLKSSTQNVLGSAQKAFQVYKQIIQYIKNRSKHESCPHPHSCVYYICSNSLRLFSYGLGAQVALRVFLQRKQLFSKPKLVMASILEKGNLNLGACVGGIAGLYRLTLCLLRRVFGKDSEKYALPAGFVSSIAFLAYPDNTIALYVMWKALQVSWNDAVERKKVPEVKWFVILLYCFSTAVLFHAAIMEPVNLRPSYWKFLYNISGGRIAVMPRLPLEVFGLNSSEKLQKVLKQTRTTDRLTYSF